MKILVKKKLKLRLESLNVPVTQFSICSPELITEVLKTINAVRREVGDHELAALPKGSRGTPDVACPVARALMALVLPTERKLAFQYPWYAAAATKLWSVPFVDALLMSVAMPETIYDFAVGFRTGNFPELEEQR